MFTRGAGGIEQKTGITGHFSRILEEVVYLPYWLCKAQEG